MKGKFLFLLVALVSMSSCASAPSYEEQAHRNTQAIDRIDREDRLGELERHAKLTAEYLEKMGDLLDAKFQKLEDAIDEVKHDRAGLDALFKKKGHLGK